MTTESSFRRRGANELLRQRAMADRGSNEHPDGRPRLTRAAGQRRQVQMGEVLRPQQHA